MADNYFLNYHELVLARIAHGQTQLYPHQVEALLAIYQKAARGEMDSSFREAPSKKLDKAGHVHLV